MFLVINRKGEEREKEEEERRVKERRREERGRREGRGEKEGRDGREEGGIDVGPYRNCIRRFYYVLWLGQHLS